MFAVSVFHAINPEHLSKGFHLGPDGELIKEPGGSLVEGTVEKKSFNFMSEFANFLQTLTPGHALAYGVCRHEKAKVVTQAMLAIAKPSSLPIVSRTREHFQYPKGQGIMMLDIDVPKNGDPIFTVEKLLAALFKACPELEPAAFVICHSASSHICKGDDELLGQRGLRVYMLVADATDIPRAGDVLFKRLWLHGYGRIEISRAGTILVRGPIDVAVFKPENLDFAGGAAVTPPLEQRRPAPIVVEDDFGGNALDTRDCLPDLTMSQESEYLTKVRAAKELARAKADEVRAKWIEDQVATNLAKNGMTSATHQDEAHVLRETYRLAGEHQVLSGDFALVHQSGQKVTVSELLNDKENWHNQRFGDPLEPGCYNDMRIAWANLKAVRPYLYSHAHGGQRYTLISARKEIRIVPGERVRQVEEVMELMRLSGDVYERGGEMVRVNERGEIFPIKMAGVLLEMDRKAAWQKYNKTSAAWHSCDAPKNVAEGVIEDQVNWRLPRLRAVNSMPTMELPSGRLIMDEGLDLETGLLFQPQGEYERIHVPENPSEDDVRGALEILWTPFAEFPFCSGTDRGVMLAAILTAIVRTSLTTAPAFNLTAPTVGCGKSLLAQCLSILAGANPPAVMAGSASDEEMRKRLLALGRSGSPVIILDNLSGALSSDSLCAWLTSKEFTDRVLSKSEQITVPTCALFLLTGNNLSMRGDLCRRVLTCRIDPGMEKPWTRGYAMNPAEYCRENRMPMVQAGLTILRAALLQKKAPADRLASFEVWSDTVRRAVIYIRDRKLMSVEDPVLAIDVAFENDPETNKLRALLTAIYDVFGSNPVGVADITGSGVDFEKTPEKMALLKAANEIAGEHGVVNTRRLGRWIERNAGRICEGLRVVRCPEQKAGSSLWFVQQVP